MSLRSKDSAGTPYAECVARVARTVRHATFERQVETVAQGAIDDEHELSYSSPRGGVSFYIGALPVLPRVQRGCQTDHDRGSSRLRIAQRSSATRQMHPTKVLVSRGQGPVGVLLPSPCQDDSGCSHANDAADCVGGISESAVPTIDTPLGCDGELDHLLVMQECSTAMRHAHCRAADCAPMRLYMGIIRSNAESSASMSASASFRSIFSIPPPQVNVGCGGWARCTRRCVHS